MGKCNCRQGVRVIDAEDYALPLRARTPVDGLFLTGADLASCGVGGALLGGLLTAGAILGPRPVLQVVRR